MDDEETSYAKYFHDTFPRIADGFREYNGHPPTFTNQQVMQAILKLAMIRLSVPSLGQIATIKLLKNSADYTHKITAEYKRRRDVVSQGLQHIPGAKFSQSQGAFYQVVRLPIENAEEFIKFLLTDFNYRGKTILLSPMEDFYITRGLGRNEVRIAYVLEVKKLEEAMVILRVGLKDFLKK